LSEFELLHRFVYDLADIYALQKQLENVFER
jgi:hypothetical protein